MPFPLRNASKQFRHGLAIYNIQKEQKALLVNKIMDDLVPVGKTVVLPDEFHDSPTTESLSKEQQLFSAAVDSPTTGYLSKEK
jgi:hypothetical protein